MTNELRFMARALTHAASVASILAFALYGCGSSTDDSSGTDASVSSGQDSGVADSSTSNCSANPNGCIAHSLMSSAPSCTCLTNGGHPLCESGYIYSASLSACVVSSSGSTDAGTTDSGSSSSDAGAVSTAECTVDSDCSAVSNGKCASPATAGSCDGVCTDGVCVQSCDWANGPTGQCPSSGLCAYTGNPDFPGYCTQDPGGKDRGQACLVTFDAQGHATGDDCDRAKNVVCWGASVQNPAGVCTALCLNAKPSYCTTLGLECAAVDASIGVCLDVPAWTDTGAACTTAATCQDSASRICETTATKGTCSSDCSSTACPNDSLCVGLSDTGPFICVADCSLDSTVCAARNSSLTCTDLSTVKVCIP